MQMQSEMMILVGLFVAAVCPVSVVGAQGFNTDSILLKDIQVLTLYQGKMTTGKRSSPVPQLECVNGGTAPCSAFQPRVVQCYNRGWDGSDVQWECKTDMPGDYRFGEIDVSCEGYNYREDPYVLKGSCGLRYSIDYTEEGSSHHSYYGDYYSKGKEKLSGHTWFADMIVFGAVCLMCWAFYITCVSPRHSSEDARSTTNDDYPHGGGGGGYGWFGQGGHAPTAPPPPGFRSEYTDDASCGNATRRAAAGGAGNGGGAGGFWTGALTGGFLGYMLGNTGRRGYDGYRPWGGGGWGGGGWGGGSWGSGGAAHRSGGGGARATSGFGGTSRR